MHSNKLLWTYAASLKYHRQKDLTLLSRHLPETDVLLFTDVFETFRNTCLEPCKIDPVHFYTTARLAQQALLKTDSEYWEHEKKWKDCDLCLREFKLKLVRDIDMLLMIEKSIRSGSNTAVKRYVKANSKYTEV